MINRFAVLLTHGLRTSFRIRVFSPHLWKWDAVLSQYLIFQNIHNRHSISNHCIFQIQHHTSECREEHFLTLAVWYGHFTTRTQISWMQLGVPLSPGVSETVAETVLLQLVVKWSGGGGGVLLYYGLDILEQSVLNSNLLNFPLRQWHCRALCQYCQMIWRTKWMFWTKEIRFRFREISV